METTVKAKDVEVMDRLQRLGFTKASKTLTEKKAKAKKLMIAYEHYKFVRQEKIDAFNQKLQKETYKNGNYRMLSMTPIENYEGAPPADVLDALEVANDRKCFDSYEVAHIVDVHDPLLFGRVKGCPDRFFIAQWDNDIKITDLIGKNEG